MDEVLLVHTTCPDEAVAERITLALLEQRLAACVNRLPAVRSSYRWQGRIESAREFPLLIKTTRARYPALESAIRELHPYELPEIVALPVAAGLPAYLRWVVEQVEPSRFA